MKNRKKIIKLCCVLLFGSGMFAQQSEYGHADTSIQELSQFEYYRGFWQTEMEMVQNDGSFKIIAFKATILAKYLDDNRTFQIEFKGSKGFYSTDIRTFNVSEGKWQALFLNSKAQRWHQFSSQEIDRKMNSIIIGGYSGKESFDIKTVDEPITKDHYLKKVYHSNDGMNTWKLVYRINIKRITTNHP